MTSTTTKTISKVAALAAGFALVAMSVAVAPAAHADTMTTTTTSSTSSLQAQIASLQAQLAASQGTTMMTTTFTRSLTIGSKGSDVTALQNWLISKGYTISAGATGYFGAQTKAALAAYQSAKGISPAVGYFGPITMASVNSMGGSTTTTTTTTTTGCVAGAAFSSTTGQACGTTTTTTGPLTGGEGSLDNFKIVGSSNTSFNQGDSEQAYGFEFKANGSDLQVNRVDYDIYNSNGAGTQRPWNVFQTATLMNGSRTVGTVDASNINNWSQDGTAGNGNQIYRIRFDGLKDVVKVGSTADYYLTLTTQGSISNSNSGGVYTLYLAGQGVRATDAMGIQQYTSSNNGSNALLTVTNTTNGSIVLSTGSDNPQTTTVQADSQNVTTGVTLTTFTLQAKNSAVTLYSLPIRVATTSSAASNIVRSLKLYQGSTLLDTESIAAGQSATTTFQNLNLQIPAGTTDSFKVVADINKVDGTNFTEGSSVTVSVPGYGQDIENGSNQVSLTGSVTGNPITFRSLGLSADSAPTTSASVQNNGGNVTAQTGTFNFTFNVTAFGQDAYIASTSAAFTATVFDYTNNSATTSALIASSLTSTADRSGLGNYVVHSGQTKQITVQSTVSTGAGHFYYVVLNSLKFNTSDSADGISGDKTVTLPTAYQTSQLKINS
jgi:hypothetical protein